MSPVRLVPHGGHSRHACAAANDARPPLRLWPKDLTACGKTGARRSPAGTLCPKARGLSPQHAMGASSPSVRCEAVLPLPFKKALN